MKKSRKISEQIYLIMLAKEVITLEEVLDSIEDILNRRISSQTVRSRYLYRLQKQGKVRSIRRGLYHAINPYEAQKDSVSFLIASKVRADGFIGYHTALEYYGLGHCVNYNEVYICVASENKRFQVFDYMGRRYVPVIVTDSKSDILELKHNSHSIRVPSRERTFIDCIDRPLYAGGWHELINSLIGMKGLREEHLLEILLERENQFLVRRVGMVVELLRNESSFIRESLSESFLEILRSHVKGSRRKLLRQSEAQQMSIREQDGELDEDWQLIIPSQFHRKTGMRTHD